VDGWDMVQLPRGAAAVKQRGAAEVMRLPPPPSDATSTRHWERAMITDSTRPVRLPTSQKLMEQLVPLGQGAIAGASAAADRGMRLWRGLRGGS